MATVGAVSIVLAAVANAQAVALLTNAGFNTNTVARNDDLSAKVKFRLDLKLTFLVKGTTMYMLTITETSHLILD